MQHSRKVSKICERMSKREIHNLCIFVRLPGEEEEREREMFGLYAKSCALQVFLTDWLTVWLTEWRVIYSTAGENYGIQSVWKWATTNAYRHRQNNHIYSIHIKCSLHLCLPISCGFCCLLLSLCCVEYLLRCWMNCNNKQSDPSLYLSVCGLYLALPGLFLPWILFV